MAKNPENNFPKKSDHEPWEYGTFVQVDNLPRLIESLEDGLSVMLADDALEPPLKRVIGWAEPGEDENHYQIKIEIYPEFSDCAGDVTNDLLAELAKIYDYEMHGGFYPVFHVGKSRLVLERLPNGFRISTGEVDAFEKSVDLLPPPALTERRDVYRLMQDLAELLKEVVEQLYLNSGDLAPDQDIVLAPRDWQDFLGLEVEPEISEFDTKPLSPVEAAPAQLPVETGRKVTFDDIGGNQELKEELMTLAAGIRDPKIYERWGIRPPVGILIEGKPGVGKTLAVQALANEAGVTLVMVMPQQIWDMWLGNSEKFMNALFDEANARPNRTILFFDEIEAMFSTRNNPTSSDAKHSVQSILFQRMSGMGANSKVTVIGATNHPENLDPALLRPGRFDTVIKVPFPDADARREIFQIHVRNLEETAGRKIFTRLKWAEIIEKTEGFSGADISGVLWALVNQRVREGLRRSVKQTISHQELISAIEKFRPDERQRKKSTLGFPGLPEGRRATKSSRPKTR